MNTQYEDITIDCRDCRTPFTWTAGQQQYFAERQLMQPRRCEQCRRWRRQQQAEAASVE
jgi:hypothetical protein